MPSGNLTTRYRLVYDAPMIQSLRVWFKWVFAGASGNEKDAPKAAIYKRWSDPPGSPM
jgi:hypothetical protein